MNARVLFAELLQEMGGYLQERGDKHRPRAYEKAAMAIALAPETTPIDQLPGVGKSILAHFREFESTGVFLELVSERQQPIHVLSKVYGVGPKKARELIETHNIISVETLRQKQWEIGLTPTQRVGLQYYDDMQLRIPRSEIDQFQQVFERMEQDLSTGIPFHIVGSYRRGAATSGDMDVILVTSSIPEYKRRINWLQEQGYLEQILAQGDHKTLGLIRYSRAHPARRVDFLRTTEQQCPFALLYFTGSKWFNIAMRQYALEMWGVSLNEYTWTAATASEKPSPKDPWSFYVLCGSPRTEEEIFERLDLQYVPSEQRVGPSALVRVNKITSTEVRELYWSMKGRPAEHRSIPENPVSVSVPVLVPKTREEEEEDEKEEEEWIGELIRRANRAYETTSQPIMSDSLYDQVVEYVSVRYPNHPVLREIGYSAVSEKEEKEKEKDESRQKKRKMLPGGTASTARTGTEITVELLRDVKLPCVMPSMNKVYTEKEWSQWLRREECGSKGGWVSEKLDGMSVLFVPPNSTTQTAAALYTRGDGVYGVDISHILPHLAPSTVAACIRTVVRTQHTNFVIRGELIMPKAVFQAKYAGGYQNSRNMIPGLVRKFHPIPVEKLRDVCIVMYEWIPLNGCTVGCTVDIDRIESPEEQWRRLHEEYGWEVPRGERIPASSLSRLTQVQRQEMCVQWRRESAYELDGIIVTVNEGRYAYSQQMKNPSYAVACKVAGEAKVTRVKDVHWNITKDGLLIPTIELDPGVNVSGANVTNVTMHNANRLIHGYPQGPVGPGALVSIRRNGEVIPGVVEVVRPTRVPWEEVLAQKMKVWGCGEDVYEFCKWDLDDKGNVPVHLCLRDLKEQDEVQKKRLEQFFVGIEVDGMGPGTIQRLYEAGYKTIADILKMQKADYLSIPGYKEKMAEKLWGNVQRAIQGVSRRQLMVKSNALGRGWGEARIELVMNGYPELDTWEGLQRVRENPVEWSERLQTIPSIGPEMATKFVSRVPEVIQFIQDSGLEWKWHNNTSNDSNNPMATTEIPAVPIPEFGKQFGGGKKVVFTGTRNREAMELLKKWGAVLTGSVSKQTYCVIAEDEGGQSGKLSEARELNIPIYTLAQILSYRT